MAVKVKKEPEEWGDLEKCVVCGIPTSYWWGDGCAPLCSDCARAIDDRTIRGICEREGYGPIPDPEK